jgi:hypothetical protein
MLVNAPQHHLGNRTIHHTGICILAVVLAVFMGPAVANATTSPHVLTISHFYETNNDTVYLVTDGTTPYGDAETGNPPGRDIYLSDTGFRYVDPSGLCGSAGCEVYHLVLNSGYCLAPDNSYVFVEIRDCSNSNVNWAVKGSPPTLDALWINVGASDAFGSDQVLAGSKDKGLDIELCGLTIGISCSGLYTNWSA